MAVARYPPTHALPPSASARYFTAVARRIVLVTVCGDECVDCRRACLRSRSRTVARMRDFTQRARWRNDRAAVRSNGKHHSAATHVFHFTREKSARSSPARARYTRARIRRMCVRPPRFPRDSRPVLSAKKKNSENSGLLESTVSTLFVDNTAVAVRVPRVPTFPPRLARSNFHDLWLRSHLFPTRIRRSILYVLVNNKFTNLSFWKTLPRFLSRVVYVKSRFISLVPQLQSHFAARMKTRARFVSISCQFFCRHRQTRRINEI